MSDAVGVSAAVAGLRGEVDEIGVCGGVVLLVDDDLWWALELALECILKILQR